MSHRTSYQQLDSIKVLLSFEYTPREYATALDPGSAASVSVLSAALNGEWVDASVFHPAVIQVWEQSILEEILDEAV